MGAESILAERGPGPRRHLCSKPQNVFKPRGGIMDSNGTDTESPKTSGPRAYHCRSCLESRGYPRRPSRMYGPQALAALMQKTANPNRQFDVEVQEPGSSWRLSWDSRFSGCKGRQRLRVHLRLGRRDSARLSALRHDKRAVSARLRRSVSFPLLSIFLRGLKHLRLDRRVSPGQVPFRQR